MKNKLVHIEQVIACYLPEEKGFQKTIFEACNYSILAGGKRIRPMMMEEMYYLLGGEVAGEIEPFMAAIEMIHTSSLVHDDLPCMDNDTYRRGRKTTWVQYGYDMAVLAGDALLTYAFETASKAFEVTNHPERVGRAIGILAHKTGIYGMIGGQTVDVEMTGKALTKEQIDFIYRLKTGALLEASLMIGAVLAGASEENIKKTKDIAARIGMAFQIRDDILDLTSTTEILGKPVMSDEKNKKITYVTYEGIEKSEKDVEYMSQEAMEELCNLTAEAKTETAKEHGKFLQQLTKMLITREK